MTLPPRSPHRFARIGLVLALVAAIIPLGSSASALGNQALQFDGTNDLVTFGAAPSLGTSTFTLETWFRRTGTGTPTTTGTGGLANAVGLVTKGRGEGENSNVDMNYFLGINTTTNTLAADFEEGAGQASPGLNHPISGSTVITNNVWHHAAVTYDGNEWRLYLDGVLDGTLIVGQLPRSDSIQHAGVGAAMTSVGTAVNGPAGYFAGQLDEARIWNSARSLSQIQAGMNTEIASAAGLLGRWGMNEGTGTTAANTASAGLAGTLTNGPTWVAGAPLPANHSIQFDGTNDLVTFGAAPGLGASEFTLETWFRRTTAGVGTSTGTGGLASAVPLVTKGRGEAEGSNLDMNYFLGIDTATSRLAADFEEGAGQASPGLNHPIIGTTTITSNVWHHAAVTYDGTTWRLYLDGALDGTLAVGQLPRSDSIQHAGLGVAMTSGGATGTSGLAPQGFFAGQMDEARIWNSARSLSQIQAGMSTEISSATGLLGRWGMNEGSGTTAVNTATAGLAGTLTNGPTWVAGAPMQQVSNFGVAFDGINDSVTFGTAASLGASNFTVETWFNRTGAGVGTSTGSGGITAIPLVTKGRAQADNSNLDMNYFLGIDAATGRLVADYEEGAGQASPGLNHPVTGATVVTQSTWHHAAVTFNGTDLILYLDGVEDGRITPGTNHGPRSDSIQHAALGTAMLSDGDDDGWFAGVLDEARIWNVARSEAQIQAAMSGPLTSGSGLIGRWGLNEAFGTIADNSVSLTSGTLTNGPTWVAGTTFEVPNAAPVIDAVSIDQSNPDTNDTLSATITSHDGDDDPLTFTYQWTEGGNDIPGATNATLDLGTAGNGDRGDLIRVRVRADDGAATSAPLTSAPVTVANTAPVATVSLSDHSPGTGATLTATATASDLDTDTVSLTYTWTVDGQERASTTTTSLTDAFDLSLAGNGDNGQLVVVTVTPNDGSIDGAAVTDSATVGNAAPVIDAVSIDQSNPDTNDTLSATITSHDGDDDPLTFTYQWTEGGNDIPGATNATLDLGTAGNGDRGDLIRVRVRADDGAATSAPLTSAPVTVANTAPVATVDLSDHSPGTGATLTATATASDLDTDTVSLTYTWTVDGQERASTTTTSLTDAFDLSLAGNGDNGQLVVVTVTPNDGSIDGAAVTDSATVGNAAPVIDAVSIDQSNPDTNDTLSATITSHDGDDDPLTFTYQWTEGGNDIPGATNATLDLGTAGNGDRGDLIRVRVRADDGAATSAPLTSAPVTVANTAPVATVDLSDHSPGTGATLTATATASDLDTDTVSLTYTWTVDGQERASTTTTSLTDAFDLSLAGNGDNGQLVVVTVTPNDGSIDGAAVTDSATVGNAAPVIDAVSIDQSNPDTNDTLSATITSHDGDDDPLTFTYQWTEGGNDIPGATNATLDLGTAGNGDRGDLIRVRVRADDGAATSAPLTSAPVTVANTAPVATVDLSDHSPGTGATLTATATASDLDTDTVSLTYTWTVDGQERASTTTTSLTDAFDLSLAGNGDNGQLVVVTVTPNDGSIDGAAVTDSATVGNAAPVIDAVSIDQSNPDTNDTLSATITSHDGDDDPLTFTYQWTEGGNDIPGATNATLDLGTAGNGDRGDLIRVRVRADDGAATSAPLTSAPVTVANTAPVATVSLSDHSPGTGATLTATATASDLDTDTVSLTYTWTVDGQERASTTTTSLTDAFDLSLAGNGDNGQLVVVTVTPNDGSIDGAAVTDSATVGNAAPVIDAVSIDQSNPDTNDTLSATITSHDGDDDPLTFTYQWTEGGNDIPGATNATLDLGTAGNGDRGDLIRVRVRADDGAATSAPLTSAPVTVANTAPVATVYLSDHSPGTGATLTATATASDLDTDTVSLTYTWTVDGQERASTTTTSLTDAFDLSLAGNGDNGQLVVVTVTPNDGSIDGAAVTDSATVAGPGAPAIFSDGFASANFTNWTAFTRLTIDNAIGNPGAPSARAQVTNQSAFAYRDLGATYNQVCMSLNVNLATGSGVDLFRLRTAGNGAIIKAFVAANGTLQLRSDFASTSFNSGVALGSGWHNVELCGTVGTNTTWDLYRDGVRIVNAWQANTGTTPVGRIQIGDTAAKTFTVNFDNVIVDQVVGENQPGDTTPPTVPGQPAGTSPSTSSIQISWAASSDPSVPITYRIYRDGNPTSIGSTTDTSFTDTGLAPGSSHTYRVEAVDAANNVSALSPASASITVSSAAPAIFSDGFASANFTNWTAFTRLTIDNAIGNPGAPSARAQVTNQSAFAYRDLGATYNQVCMSLNVNLATGSGVDLFRLRTAGNGAIIKAFVAANGTLQLRSDFASTSFNSGVALGSGWHNVELCGTVGTNTTWDLYRDGVRIVNAWQANTGTTPVGRIQIGDTAAKTFTVNFDNVIVDQVVGENQPGDTTPPTVPGQPAGTSPSTSSIQIGWAASSDPSVPITYRIYRDGNPTSIGSTTDTSFTDTGLAPGSSHTYRVEAVDAANNVSALSPASASITVSSAAPAIFSDGFASANFTNWTAFTRLTIDNAIGNPGAPSARAQVTNQSAFAYRDLGATYNQVCMSLNVNLATGSGVDLFRLRTAGNGAIIKAFVAANGTLQLRSDFASTSFNSGVALGSGWHNVELCGTVGTNTTWDLYRDGVRIVNAWQANTGTTPVGRIQIGDTAAKTFTVNFDNVIVDQVVGG